MKGWVCYQCFLINKRKIFAGFRNCFNEEKENRHEGRALLSFLPLFSPMPKVMRTTIFCDLYSVLAYYCYCFIWFNVSFVAFYPFLSFQKLFTFAPSILAFLLSWNYCQVTCLMLMPIWPNDCPSWCLNSFPIFALA